MSEALRTFSSSWLFTSAILSFSSARSLPTSASYFARSTFLPTHDPIGPDTAATSAATMVVIISPLIHVVYCFMPTFVSHVFTLKLGHALLANSLCPCTVAPGYRCRSSFTSFTSAASCAAVRVSFPFSPSSALCGAGNRPHSTHR